MKDELDKQLCEKYPKIFKMRHGSMQETAMCWGFPGDGWFEIINTACRNIQHHIDWKRKVAPYAGMTDEEFDETHQPVAAQVKEKFGGLRFYMDNADDYVYGILSMAESLSFRTCETCGAPGKTGGVGWLTTRCETCNTRQANDRIID